VHFCYPIISFPSRASPRKSDLTSTTCCSEAEAASASACSAGQVLLGCDASTLARMEAGIDPGSARDGRPVASDGIQAVLEVLSRHRTGAGRKCVNRELRELIFRMVAENRTWGAPRIHGELKMLGFGISERTVLRWMRKAPRNPEPAKRWATFLNNHQEAIAAMDCFTVPTLTLGVLHCFFVIAHDRRRIFHSNVTRHPSSAWVAQQLRETFPYDSVPGYLIFDRAANFDEEVIDTVKTFGIQPKRTSFRSPWQNGVAERWVGNCRRDLLDHVIVLNERHLKRLMSEYVRYYNWHRPHTSLNQLPPISRAALDDNNLLTHHSHCLISAPSFGLYARPPQNSVC
jgi:putative transposase